MNTAIKRLSADLLRPAFSLAWLRLGLLAVFWLSERLADQTHHHTALFDLTLAIGGFYALLALTAARHSQERPPGGWLPYVTLDLVFITMLVYASAGAFSQLRYAFSIIPVVTVFLGRPRHTAIATAAALTAFATVELARRALGAFTDIDQTMSEALNLIWQSAFVLVLCLLLTRKRDRIEQLADDRRRLVAQALAVEEREQRRLAQALHDEAVQSLFAAQLELPRIARGDNESLRRAQDTLRQVTHQLRGAIFELHPYTLEHAGIAATLEQIARQQAANTAMRVAISVDTAAEGIHDRLIFTLARELLLNAAKHAHATHLTLTVAREDNHIVLDVEDNGRGFDPETRHAALRQGHIGLASNTERIEGLGGTFTVRSTPGHGTHIRACIPTRRRADQGHQDNARQLEPAGIPETERRASTPS